MAMNAALQAKVMPRMAKSAIQPVAAQFKELRDRVCSEHLAGGLLYLEAGKEQLRNGYDVYHKFRAGSNFHYMSA
eukprot:gene13188-19021_t